MCALISRSTSLQKFSLIKTIVPSEDIFLQLLTALKSVTEFVLEVPGIASKSSPLTDRILQQLNPGIAADLGADCLLPSLETFRYRGPQSFTLTESIAAIKSRLPNRSLHNDFSPLFSRPVKSWHAIKFDLTNLTSNIPKAHQYISTQLQQISLGSPQVDLVFNLPQECQI